MTTGKAVLMINPTTGTIRAYESKFEKVIGDKIYLDGHTYHIFACEKSVDYAKVRLGMFSYENHLNCAKQRLSNVKFSI